MEGSYGWGGLREEGIMKTSVYRAWGIRVSRAKGDWDSWIMKIRVYGEWGIRVSRAKGDWES